MDVQQDFKELLHLFNETRVEYIVVGGYALAYHGAPRYTGDLDLWIRISPQNSDNVITALKAFGFGGLGVSAEDLDQPDQILQLGYPPVRIDIITSIDGVEWDDASANAIEASYGDEPVKIIAREDFIRNKRASGRHKDLADIEALGESP